MKLSTFLLVDERMLVNRMNYYLRAERFTGPAELKARIKKEKRGQHELLAVCTDMGSIAKKIGIF